MARISFPAIIPLISSPVAELRFTPHYGAAHLNGDSFITSPEQIDGTNTHG
jgi:hypothetical protein